MIPEGYKEKYENPHTIVLVWKDNNIYDVKTMNGDKVMRVTKIMISREGNSLTEAKLTRIYLDYDQRHKVVLKEYEHTCVVGKIEVL